MNREKDIREKPAMRLSVLQITAILLVAWAGNGWGLAEAAEYYVANGGSDGGTGTQAAPFATVAHALTVSSSGDTIYLQRGSVFREAGLSLGNGKTLTAYGDAANPLPVLAGSIVATNWTPWPTNNAIYRASLSSSLAIEQVYVGGVRATLARYPNSGWLRTDSGSSDNTILDAELASHPQAAANRWVGAQVRWRKWSWWYETRPITGDNGSGTLTLGGATSGNNTGEGSGYYIDHSLAELDAPGEWFWDAANGLLYLYPPQGTDPAGLFVEAAYQPQGIAVGGGSLQSIALRHYTNDAVSVGSPSSVSNCLIEHIGDVGIAGSWNAFGSTISGCTIRDILNVGLTWNENPAGTGGTIIERNRLDRIGAVPGLGGSGSWHAAGIILSNANESGSGVIVRLNRITETGYAGIILGADRQTVERNVFVRCMSTLNDGGAIYANAHNNIIRENIILDTIGDLDSSHPWTPLGHGIWIEFLSNFSGSQVTDNTVYGSGGNGLFLPNNFDCQIQNNVFISNRLSGLHLGGHENGRSDGQPNQNHTIQGNLLGMGARPWQASEPENLATWSMPDDHALSFTVHGDRDLDFGSMSGTTFLTTDGTDLIKDSSNTPYTIAAWQTAESDWADSAPSSVQGSGYLFINDTETPLQFPLPKGITWQNLAGANVGADIQINPFRSVVLLATNGDTSGLSGSILASQQGNSAPVASAQNVTTPVNTPRAITLLASDPDGDALTYSLVAQPAHGTLTGTVPNVTYTPDAGYSGPDQFTFTASDGALVSNVAGINITVGTGPGGTGGPTASPLSITKALVRLKFKRAGADKIMLKGLLPVPEGYHPEGQVLTVNVGGVENSFTMDSRGRAKNDTDRFMMRMKKKKKQVLAQDAKFTCLMKNGTFGTTLSASGLLNESLVSQVSIEVSIAFNGVLHAAGSQAGTAALSMSYKGKAGVGGAAKMVP